MYKIIGPV